jgi:hypothetical protein
LGLPATDTNAAAMLRALGAAEDASIAYGHFRRFAILIPGEKLLCDTDANITWFESATCVPLGSALLRFVPKETRLLIWLWSILLCRFLLLLVVYICSQNTKKTSAQAGSGVISKQQFPSKQQATDRSTHCQSQAYQLHYKLAQVYIFGCILLDLLDIMYQHGGTTIGKATVSAEGMEQVG